jgi:Ni,Fe-hydrogenase III small subunit
MTTIYQLYKINTGSCGGCDSEILEAVATAPDLAWADTPLTADALLLTGPLLPAMRQPLQNLTAIMATRPVLAIGRCALDGHSFGRGGVRAQAKLTVQLELDGCPPTPEEIAAAIRTTLATLAQEPRP